MWPWAHAALGYLLYTGILALRDDGQPRGVPVLALGIGTQVPDLVDKPLAWYLHVLPYGRTLAHSLFVAVPLLLVVGWYADRKGKHEVGVAFAVGYLSHLLGDAFAPLVTGEWTYLGFLVWPLQPPPERELEGVVAHLMSIEGTATFLFGLLLTAIALLQWNEHGRPGLGELHRLVARPGR